LGAEVAQVGRFGLKDEVLALDGYKNLWNRAYANLRVRINPKSDILPNADVRGELFQALESGWEVSGSYWRLDLDLEDVDVMGVGLAKYHGDWYLRQVTNVSRLAGKFAVSLSFAVRRLLNPPHEYVELSGGIGEEAVLLGPGPVVDLRHTRFVRGSVQRFFSTHWGYSTAAMFNLFEGTPERWGLKLGLLTRF